VRHARHVFCQAAQRVRGVGAWLQHGSQAMRLRVFEFRVAQSQQKAVPTPLGAPNRHGSFIHRPFHDIEHRLEHRQR
jgi:hypothetical protein